MPSSIHVYGTLGTIGVQLQIEMPQTSWWAAFVPTLPGLVLAAVGLYVAHRLTLRRERRKEIRELCARLDAAISDAADSAADAWLITNPNELSSQVQATKAKIQALGIQATALRRNSRVIPFGYFHDGRKRRSIDLVGAVSELRQVSTVDPFEDPDRPPSLSDAQNVRSAAIVFQGKLQQELADYESLPE